VTVSVAGELEGQQAFEDLCAAVDEFFQAFAPIVRAKRALGDRHDLERHAFGDFAVKTFHVREMPEDSAEADASLFCDFLCAWRDRTRGDQLQQRVDDTAAIVFAADAAAVDIGLGCLTLQHGAFENIRER